MKLSKRKDNNKINEKYQNIMNQLNPFLDKYQSPKNFSLIFLIKS